MKRTKLPFKPRLVITKPVRKKGNKIVQHFEKHPEGGFVVSILSSNPQRRQNFSRLTISSKGSHCWIMLNMKRVKENMKNDKTVTHTLSQFLEMDKNQIEELIKNLTELITPLKYVRQ